MGKGKFPEELTTAILCLKTGWTVQELDNQPAWVIEDILIYLNAESIANQSQNKGK
jgi:cytochrome bd-type quinol oxidase subunit 1